MPARSREYDLVLFGATGFTGRLVADHLARSAPAELRWAVAGRDLGKLERLRAAVANAGPASASVDVIQVDSHDVAELRALTRCTRVVASTVGQFMERGAPLVAACAANGTDYADITGEAEFVDRSWLLNHVRATETGARLVHCCGFDTVPHDLGAWWTLQHLPTGVPISMAGYVRASGAISAGTYHSAVRAFGRVRQARDVAGQRRVLEARLPDSRSVGATPLTPHREPSSGRWSVPLPTIDPIVVHRSARACEEYGPAFRYGHFAVVGGLPAAAAVMVGGVSLMTLAKVPPARAAMLRLKSAGEGPTQQRRSTSWFRVRFVAKAGERTVVTEVSGGDPGYDETAKMLGESALALACDDLPDRAGQLTPVEAMGPALVSRLQRVGISFRLVDSPMAPNDDARIR